THDQEEALTMSDRLAVFNRGKIEQVGAPSDLYERPTTGFVAGFVGTSNIVSGKLAEMLAGSPDAFSLRPEKIRLSADNGTPITTDADTCVARGTIRDVIYLGMNTRYLVELENSMGDLTVVQQNLEASSVDVAASRGSKVILTWHKSNNRRLSASGSSAPATTSGGERPS
ncbi:MAG TPA: TOBE domain-containing protein, partial [Phototrophicaceae bacterium]|nr:TOBE domain-containing protein [Phototrophicaceae bacterium]